MDLDILDTIKNSPAEKPSYTYKSFGSCYLREREYLKTNPIRQIVKEYLNGNYSIQECENEILHTIKCVYSNIAIDFLSWEYQSPQYHEVLDDLVDTCIKHDNLSDDNIHAYKCMLPVHFTVMALILQEIPCINEYDMEVYAELNNAFLYETYILQLHFYKMGFGELSKMLQDIKKILLMNYHTSQEFIHTYGEDWGAIEVLYSHFDFVLDEDIPEGYCEYSRECDESKKINGDENISRSDACYKKWHDECLERDGHKCVVCGNSESKLHVHHLDGFNEYPSRRVDPDNGITLCVGCHNNYHSMYGRDNNTARSFIEFVCKQKALEQKHMFDMLKQ